ncbi:serine hydrolase [Neisseria leonii]|uniref:serine hydrolase n=1 Tax=Neisseria leonii TaxID=2995413 RepID=UPI00237B41BF|nr:serine hydrolase [Neisseria sp. 3986]MDD9325923.1 serine hydrolase [Neisseria sp. 3986]
MNSREREDLTLLLIRDAAEAPMWIDNWAAAFPAAVLLEARSGTPEALLPALNRAAAGSRPLAAVAHGAGAAAVLHWLYQADIRTRGRLKTLILAAPDRYAFDGDAARAVCPCPAAVLHGRDDPDSVNIRRQAARWHAACLTAPENGRLNGRPHGWEWGAKLLQEMLLA